MLDTLKNISLFIVISTIVVVFCIKLESTFLFSYLSANLLGLLLTLLAINTATLGLIASKIQDMLISYPTFNFDNTIKQMKLSLLEQIILIIVSIITLIIQDSKQLIFTCKNEISNIILVGVLIYSIDILWDTGKGVFVIIEELQKFKKNNPK